MNELPTGIAIMNLNREITYTNQQFLNLMGFATQIPKFNQINDRIGNLSALDSKSSNK